jgi:hypothetical protein
MTTQWSKRRDQIKADYTASLAQELEIQQKIKRQIEEVNEDGTINTEVEAAFDSLINLNAIAEKAKLAKIRKEERLLKKNKEV